VSTPHVGRKAVPPSGLIRPTHLIALAALALLALRTPRLGAAWYNNLAARRLNATHIPPELTPAERTTAAVDAGRALVRALRFEPAFGRAYTNLGTTYTALGDVSAAAQALSEAVTYTPRDWRAHFFYGHALAALGREAEARAAWRAADASRYFARRYDDLRRDDPDAALQAAERASAADVAGITGHLTLAAALTAREAYTDALAIYEEAIRRAPDDVEALAQAHAEMGTLLHSRLGRSADGVAALELAIALRPQEEEFRLTLAGIASERGACYEAESLLAPLFERPSTPGQRAQANVLVGRCLMALDRPRSAVPYFARAIDDQPDTVSHWVLLGEAHRAAGEDQAAVEAYTRALELNPDHSGAQRALDELQGDAP